jgi:hypothetical protein
MKLIEFVQDHMVTHLLSLCKSELNIQDLPPIELIDTDHTVGGSTSFGLFDGEKIQVITLGRHQMDIMRTLAHELVHWKQQQEGMELNGEDGSEIENQANAIAAVIMRKFGKKYPHYFVSSLP